MKKMAFFCLALLFYFVQNAVAANYAILISAGEVVISKHSDSHFNKDSDTSSLSKTLKAI